VTIGFDETLEQIERGVVAFSETHDLVTARGLDARSFLQGQLSQDLSILAPGESCESLVLSPQGKLEAYVRVCCIDEETFVLDVAAGFGELLLDRLRRFKLRVKVEFQLQSRELLAIRGPLSVDLVDSLHEGICIFRVDWPSLVGFDLVDAPQLLIDQLPLGNVDALEVARIRSGLPKMGLDLDEKTIVQETPLTPRSVSFTKGCFTGQELVARIDARGANVPRHLCLLLVQPGPRHRVPYAGEPVHVGGKEVGLITSAGYSPTENRSYALAYIHRGVTPPASGQIIAADGEDILSCEIQIYAAEIV
jgi:folate-binding protein YgfZ